MSLILRSLLVFLFIANTLAAQPAYFVYPTGISHINDMAHQGDTLWLATDSGVVMLNTILNTKQYYQSNLQGKKNKFNRIIFENGNLWAASDTNGLWQFTNGNWTNFNTQNGLPSNQITDLAQTKNGTQVLRQNVEDYMKNTLLLPTDNFDNGVYIVEVLSKEGQQLFAQKLTIIK